MKLEVAKNNVIHHTFGPGMPRDCYESVEFSVRGVECLHQFRILQIDQEDLCVLVREDSEILRALEVGDVLPLKYYTSDTVRPTIYLDTEIRHITKEAEGRFRGHYLIGLSILRSQGEPSIH